MTRNCECCGKELEYYFSGQKYCNNCSVNNGNARRLTDYYKGKYGRLKRDWEKQRKIIKEYELKTKKVIKTYYKKE